MQRASRNSGHFARMTRQIVALEALALTHSTKHHSKGRANEEHMAGYGRVLQIVSYNAQHTPLRTSSTPKRRANLEPCDGHG